MAAGQTNAAHRGEGISRLINEGRKRGKLLVRCSVAARVARWCLKQLNANYQETRRAWSGYALLISADSFLLRIITRLIPFEDGIWSDKAAWVVPRARRYCCRRDYASVPRRINNARGADLTRGTWATLQFGEDSPARVSMGIRRRLLWGATLKEEESGNWLGIPLSAR